MSEVLIPEPETYASLQIKKLRIMHESALKFRLEIKRKMQEIILHWKNYKISHFFAKWKLLRVKTTYYEKIKLKWIAHIRKRRSNQIDAVRFGKVKSEKSNFIIANMMRNETKLNSLEKRSKDQNELRAKSAQVSLIRNLLKSRQNTSRQINFQRKTRSAFHGKSESVL